MRRIIIGIDYGNKHIGLARGDTDVKLASELGLLINTGDDNVWMQILDIIRSEQADAVVVGLPRDNEGAETSQTAKCRQFANDLRQHLIDNDLKVDVFMQDESLTSVKAEQQLRRERHFDPIMLRNGKLDIRAAVIILSDYLEGYYG